MTAKADLLNLRSTLKAFLPPGQVTELRALAVPGYKGSKQTHSGYFDDALLLEKSLVGLQSAPTITFIPNPVVGDLLARCANKTRKLSRGESLTTDIDMIGRQWLPVCLSAVCRSGMSATDAERNAAMDGAQRIKTDLTERGWPAPYVADSGNGTDLIYRIDLPVDDDGVVKNVLHALATQYGGGEVRVNEALFEASFPLTLYGTPVKLGSSVSERPYRGTGLLETPEDVRPVSRLLLEEFIGTCPGAVERHLPSDEPDRPTAPRVYTLSDLRRVEFAEPEPIVEDMLRSGETALIVGRPKTGKSRLTQQLTIALSRQQTFLGKHISRKHRVLLLDLENRAVIAQSRFQKMSLAHADDDNVRIIAPDSLSEISLGLEGDGLARLRAIVIEHRPDVLIIDTWRLFIGPVDENKSEEVMKGLKRLSSLKKVIPGLTIILVHHLRKQFSGGAAITLRDDPYTWVESVSGHHALVGHVDCCFGLEREAQANGDELIVFGGVARNSASSTMLLDEDPDTLMFSQAEGTDALRTILTPVELKHWQVAKSLQHFTFTELFSKADTTNKKSLSALLRKAKAQNAVEQKGAIYVVRG